LCLFRNVEHGHGGEVMSSTWPLEIHCCSNFPVSSEHL